MNERTNERTKAIDNRVRLFRASSEASVLLLISFETKEKRKQRKKAPVAPVERFTIEICIRARRACSAQPIYACRTT